MMNSLSAFFSRYKKYYPYIVATLASCATIVVLLAYLLLKAGGEPWAAMYPGAVLPTPTVVAQEGVVKPVFDAGWDGQFYLFQAYDPFMRHVTEINQYFDESAYRYQRNFIPSLTWALHGVLPFLNVATVFLLIQCAIVISVSFYVARFFYRNGISVWFLLPMQLNAGVIATLRHGLPDVSSDFLFYASVVALLEKRKWLSIALLTALCLTREPYVAFAAGVVIYLAIDAVQRAKKIRLADVIDVLPYIIPGVAFVVWYAFVVYTLGKTPTSEGGFMVGGPLRGFIEGVELMVVNQKSNWEIISAIYYFQLLLLGWFLVVYGITKKYFFVIPFALLMLTTSALAGWGWSTWPHHSKNLSYLLGALPVLLLVVEKKRFQYTVLALTCVSMIFSGYFIVGGLRRGGELEIQGTANVNLAHPVLAARPENIPVMLQRLGYDESKGFPRTFSLTDYSARLTLIKPEETPQRVWTGTKQFAIPFSVNLEIQNTGTQPWSPFVEGDSAPVWYSIKWVEAGTGKVLSHTNKPLSQYVYPGEAYTTRLSIMPPNKPGKAVLIISPAQTPVIGFETKSPSAKIEIPIELY